MVARGRVKDRSTKEPAAAPAPRRSRGVRIIMTVGVLVLAYLFALPANAFRASQRVPPFEVLLEYSWNCDLTTQLVEGRYSGRDFVYTYGPLRQVLHGIGSIVDSGDLAARARLDRSLVAALGVAGVWWLLAQTRAPWPWRAALLLAWFGLDFDLHIKPLAAIVVTAGCGRQLAGYSGQVESRLRRAWPFVAWVVAAPLATLYSFDLGVFVGAALVALGIGVTAATAGITSAEVSRARRRSLALTTCAIVGAAAFVAVLELPLGWQNYLRDTLSMARGYVGQLAYPLEPAHFGLLIVAGCVAVGTMSAAVRRLRQSWRAGQNVEPVVYEQLGMGILSLLLLRYALTGSDPPHVVDALLPVIFWWGCLVPALWLSPRVTRDASRGEWRRVARWALPLVLFTKVLLVPHAVAATWRARLAAIREIGQQAPRLVMDGVTHRAVAAARDLPGETLVVWPNESFIAQAAGKRNPLYTLQTIMETNPHLEQATIDRLKRSNDTPVLMMRTAEEFTSVSHVARAPEFFRYLLQNYELSQPPQPEFAMLRQATIVRDWQTRQVPLRDDDRIARLTDGEVITVTLADDIQDVRASDLIFLRVATTRPPWSPIGKSARLLIKLTLDTGESRIRYVPLVQNGREQTIGLSYLDPAEPLFIGAFSPSIVVRSRERLARIDIVWQPVDFLTSLPDQLTLLQFELIRREGSPVLEASINDQSKVSEALESR